MKMKKNILIKTISLIFPIIFSGQVKTIKFLNKQDGKPIIGLQIFSETGSHLGNTNINGEFEFNLHLLSQNNINNVTVYNTDYYDTEYNLNEIPSVIYLTKNVTQLKEVEIVARTSKKYYTLKGYFRSWQLINGKLIKYGDGIVDYHIPYAAAVNDFNTGVKSYIKAFRTFKGDSTAQILKMVKAPPLDGYLNVTRIPKNDILKRDLRHNTKYLNENTSEIFKDDKKIGYVIFDKSNIPVLISTATNQDDVEEINYFGKITAKFSDVEKWVGEGDTRHPVYIFSNIKTNGKLEKDGKINQIETITEIFIEDKIIYNDKKPDKYSIIYRDKSFYNFNYWDELLLKYPLPKEIQTQLTKVNENKNIY